MTEDLSRYLTSWQITIEGTTILITDAVLVRPATAPTNYTVLSVTLSPADVPLLVSLCQVLVYHSPTSHTMVNRHHLRHPLRLLADNGLDCFKPTASRYSLYSPDTARCCSLFLLQLYEQCLRNMYVGFIDYACCLALE